MKRLLDIVSALLLLLVGAPFLLLIAVAIAVTMGRPVLFRQVRPGRGEVPFTLLKFRTMSVDDTGTRSDRERLTRLGRWLRLTSLDELPSLVNVLHGDMSLVGPRPLLVRYLPYYNEHERTRHSVRPGLTGWAQIHGRNRVAWDDRLALDVWYVEHQSLHLDLRILVRTIYRALVRDGVVDAPDTALPDLDVARSSGSRRTDRSSLPS